jgi:hypothetical protein
MVVLSGIVSARTEGHDWKEIGQRMSVFEVPARMLSIFRPAASLLLLLVQRPGARMDPVCSLKMTIGVLSSAAI